MARLMLSDELCSKLKAIMHQVRIYNKPDLRMMVEGLLYRIRISDQRKQCLNTFASLKKL